jgi:hypothetical protein
MPGDQAFVLWNRGMDVLSLGPLPVASLVWQPAPGRHVLTIVCKATFDLAPVTSELSADQEAPNEDDNHWDDDPARSLYSPSDLAPFKPRADILLVGHAFAPRGEPVQSLVARLLVGELDKSIEVFGERAFTRQGGMRETARFTKMPLRYERAAGGPGTKNPVGVRSDATDPYGASLFPNLQPVGLSVSSPGDYIEPVGFGPIAPTWRDRMERLGPHAAAFTPDSVRRRPLPENFDGAYFNAAPRDQQVDAIRSGERLVLEHLHRDHARLVTSLRGVYPQARGDPAGLRHALDRHRSGPLHAHVEGPDAAPARGSGGASPRRGGPARSDAEALVSRCRAASRGGERRGEG